MDLASINFILGVLLFNYLIVNSFFIALNVSGDMMALLSSVLLSTYNSSLYNDGIEYPEVANQKRYETEKRSNVISSIRFGVIFIIAYGVLKGISSNFQEAINVIGPAILAIIFFFILNLISLRKSFSINKDLLDD